MHVHVPYIYPLKAVKIFNVLLSQVKHSKILIKINNNCYIFFIDLFYLTLIIVCYSTSFTRRITNFTC